MVALLVLDGTRADYFDTYRDVLPTLSRLRAGGAWYSQAHVSSVPTLTAVGHANLGTGAEPQTHGLAVNYLFNRVTGKSQEAYDALDPGEMLALTLADVWNIETEGQAVIVGQGGAIRATAGLVGHGACVVNGRRVRAASYSTAGDGTFQTNEKCYTLSDALKPLTARRYWTEAGGKWLGHDIGDPTKFRHSALFQRFEGDALAAVLEAEPIGADDIPDLVLVNMKGPDYVGHAYGPASPEIKEALAELDRQIARALQIIERKAGAGRFAIAIAADHGMPGEPRPGGRHYLDDIVKRIDARFSPARRHRRPVLQRRRQQRDPPRHGEAAIAEGLAAGRGGVPRSRGPLRRGLHRGRSAGGPAPRTLTRRASRLSSFQRGLGQERLPGERGVGRPFRRQAAGRFVRELQQAAIRGVGEHGVGPGRRRGEAEPAVADLEIVDAQGRDALQHLAHHRILRGFGERRVERS